MDRFTGLIWGIGLLVLWSCSIQADEFRFPYREELAGEVAFWKQIFTRYSKNQYVLHDSEYPYIQYKVVTVDSHATRRQRERILAAEKRRIREMLERIHSLQDRPWLLTAEEHQIFQQFASIDEPNKFLAASRRVRAQQGIREQFKAGVERSFRYLPHIKKVFRMYGIPEAIGYLPHMESSFNPRAVSHVRAVGMWQFMRSTARHFMRVNRIRDERWDPYISTHAAARLLKRNYQALQDWGLAITAYNYGLGGLKRAVRRFGRDYMKIRQNYLSRRFGFASRNFYPEFLAVVEIVDSLEHYFPDLNPHPPLQFTEILLPVPTQLPQLIRALKLPADSIRMLNPAYRRAVWQGRLTVPAGYPLRLPASVNSETVLAYLQLQNPRYLAQVKSRRTRTPASGHSLVAYQVLPPDRPRKGNMSWASPQRYWAASGRYQPGSWHGPEVSQPDNPRASIISPELIAYVQQTAPLYDTAGRQPLLASAERSPARWLMALSRRPQPADGRYRVGVPAPGPAVWQPEAWFAWVQSRTEQSLAFQAAAAERPSVDPGIRQAPVLSRDVHPGVQAYLAYLERDQQSPENPLPATSQEPVIAAADGKDAPLASVMVPENGPFKPMVGGPNVEGVVGTNNPSVPSGENPGALRQQRVFRREAFRQWLSQRLRPDARGTIQVYQGETLDHLARWAGVSATQLRRLNRLRTTRLYVGQQLTVPLDSTHVAAFVEQRVAFHWQQLPAVIRRAHWLGVRTYTVRQGETLSRIAAHNSEITVNILLYFNEFHKLERIYPGEEIAVIYVIN